MAMLPTLACLMAHGLSRQPGGYEALGTLHLQIFVSVVHDSCVEEGTLC